MQTPVLAASAQPLATPTGTGVAGALRIVLDRVAAGERAGAETLLALLPPTAAGPRDRVEVLRQLYALALGPLETPGDLARSSWLGHPLLAALRHRLETGWLAELAAADDGPRRSIDETDPAAVAAELRSLAATDRLPRVYRWLATTADAGELVRFLTLEGGPDADFDDLVADCQVGLVGSAKMELGSNFWDELGQGDPTEVHTTLHDRLVSALGIGRLAPGEQTIEGLERSAFGGLLATNHHLQPQMVGALGMTELQAGPRCRMVVQAFDRIGAPADAYPFYRVHADVDPRHGAGWVDNAVVPLVTERPHWGPLILQGARWRWQLNARFFAAAERELCPAAPSVAA